MRQAASWLVWSVVLGALAVAVWWAASPVTSLIIAGRPPELFLRPGSSRDVLLRMWKLQLPATLVGCGAFVLVVMVARRLGAVRWGVARLVGALAGGCGALLAFGAPLPGLPLLVWGVFLYLVVVPILLVAERLPARASEWVAGVGITAAGPLLVTLVL